MPESLQEWLNDFLSNYDKLRKYVNLNSEMAIREFLISPLIFELVKHFNIHVDIETSVYFDNTLKGNIDYILNKKEHINFIAIEAKNANINRGFNQLLVELIALDKIIESDETLLYGAVTTGNEWNFAYLDRKNKTIIQDKQNLYLLHDLDEIFKIIIGILD